MSSTHDHSRSPQGRPALMLALATVGFAVNFWAWALLSPLGPRFKDALRSAPFQQALLVAVPVVVGSLGRIPVGALTDRFGGRVMFPLVSFATIVPVLFLGLAGHRAPAGAAGRRVLPRHRRHRVRGRRAVRQRLVPAGAARPGDRDLRRRHGRHRDQRADHGQAGRRARHRRPRSCSPPSCSGRLRRRWPRWCCATLPAGPARPSRWPPAGRRPLRLPITWQASRCTRSPSAATSRSRVYLPAYLKTAYGLDAGRRRQPDGRVRAGRRGDAPGRRLAVRPVRPGPGAGRGASPWWRSAPRCRRPRRRSTRSAPSRSWPWPPRSAPAAARCSPWSPSAHRRTRSASVTGVVGAAGGLGGFVPPLVMGFVYGRTGSYGIGLCAAGGRRRRALC